MFKFFINQDASDPALALVTGFSAPNLGRAPVFTRGGAPQLELHFLRTNPAAANAAPSIKPQPFIYDNPSGWDAVKLQLGAIDAPPDSGTFTLTDPAAAQTTGPISFGAAASVVQAAIRGTLTTHYASAVVTLEPGISYAIDRGTTGAIAALTGDGTGLSPSGSTVFVERAQAGDGGHNAAVEVTLLRAAPALRTGGWGTLPGVTVAASVLVAGSGTVNKVFRIQWNPDAYAGACSFSFTGLTTTATVGPIAFDASASDVAAAFARHVDVSAASGVGVVQNGPGDYSITCLSTETHLSNAPTLATASNDLQVPVGLTAPLDLSTAGISELLGTSASVVTNLEVKKIVAGEVTTVLQLPNVTVRKDLIRNQGSALATDIATRQFLFLAGVTGYTGGGVAKLDGVVTRNAGLNAVAFIDPTAGLQVYQLSAGTDATASPGVIRPVDFDAGTNAVVWKLKNPTIGLPTYSVLGTVADRLRLSSTTVFGSVVLQRDTLHSYMLVDPANVSRASAWQDLGLASPTLIYSETSGALAVTSLPSFSASFTDHGGLVFATGDGIWHLSPPIADAAGNFMVGAIAVENMLNLGLPAGAPLAGTLILGDQSMGVAAPVAPALTSLNLSGIALTSLNLWNLVNLSTVSASGCSALSAISFTTNNVISSLAADNCALSQASVDAILSALGATINGGTVNLSGGTSSPPSSSTDVDRLVAQGWSVVTN